MSREEVTAFLRNFQLSLDSLQKQLDQAAAQLPSVKRDDLPKFLAEQKARWLRFQAEQLDDWSRFVEETGLQVEEEEAGQAAESEGAGGDITPFNVRLRSLEQRVAAMGGIPALGGLVLPKMTPAHKAGLAVTASPAAVEILRGRLGSDADAATPLRRTHTEEAPTAGTPLVQLRKTESKGPGASVMSPGEAAPQSELAAAIQRRAQRQQADVVA